MRNGVRAFQFFPSCCARRRPRRRASRPPAPPFNSFPVAVRKKRGRWARNSALFAFNSFPVAVEGPQRRAADRARALALSILSQLLYYWVPIGWVSDITHFQFFPSCCLHEPWRIKTFLAQAPFNSFPVAVRPSEAIPSAASAALSILSQLLFWIAVTEEAVEEAKTFNSFPVAVSPLSSHLPSFLHRRFQFFPSCCRRPQTRAGPSSSSSTPTFNSFPVAVRAHETKPKPAGPRDFQFFPSCCLHPRHGIAFHLFNHITAISAFNSFPVAVRRAFERALRCGGPQRFLSILSQLLWRGAPPDVEGRGPRELSILSQLLSVPRHRGRLGQGQVHLPFNSFPVAVAREEEGA